MTSEQQRREGERSGREAAEGAIRMGYLAWLDRQVISCRQLSKAFPYAAGYVTGAVAVVNARKGAKS
jgi:hypothetical protein